MTYAPPVIADFNLPEDVYEYDSNATTVLRRTHTDYNVISTYVNRRIIGLASRRTLYDGAGALASKVEYIYDEAGSVQAHSATPVRHDTANYGTGFVAGRGNLTTVRRYDVNDNSYVENKTGYYLTGTVAYAKDALNHLTTFNYNGAFYNSSVTNRFAFPTTITDPDGFASTVQYDYNNSAAALTTDPKGASVLRQYDAYDRLFQVTNQVNGAYTRYEFDSNQYYVKSYSTIQEGQGEFYSITVFDGHDRVRATVSDHPGSVGLYKGVYNAYDTMGRPWQQSNPTEINGSWVPSGDDSAWWWTVQSYDWNGRPEVTTNTNGTTKSVSYGGCGCAGGQVVTAQDEGQVNLVGPENTPTLQRRKQTTFTDALGRPWKTQVSNWDGTIYSTAIAAYDVRDQVTSLKQYQGTEAADGSCPSTTCQETWTSYDGHGRVKQQKRPVESGPSTWVYNNDDTPYSLTDARGVVTAWGYNNRHLVTSIAYTSPPNSGVAETSNVTFGYDENGNRSWMVETATTNYAGGRVDYVHNSLNQLQSETRHFNSPNRDYLISYGYNLAGQLASLTSPFGHTVSFNHDKSGRLSEVLDTASGVTTTYSSQIKYRAWGAIKSLNYGNGLTQTRTHNASLQITNFTISGRNSQYGAPDVMKAVYQYHPDGQPKFAEDQLDASFTRGWKYDHSGRLETSYTGSEAVSWLNNQPPSGAPTGPYKQNYTYNAWNEMTARDARFWSKTDELTAQFTNARRQDWGYDNAGNITGDGQSIYSFDAAGRNTRVEGSNLSRAVQSHDGDGQVIKRVESDSTGPKPWHRVYFTSYYLRSTALGGQVLAKLDQNGNLGSEDFGIGGAEEVRRYNDGSVQWVHQKPMTGSKGESRINTLYFGEEEPDSGGVDVGFSEPVAFPDDYDLDVPSYTGGGAGGDPNAPQCYIDGIPDDGCRLAVRLVSLGFASVDPRRTDGWAAERVGLRPIWELVRGKDLAPGDPRLPADSAPGESIVIHSGAENDHWELKGYEIIGAGFGLTGGQQGGEQQQVIPPFPLIVPNNLRNLHPRSDLGVNTRLPDSGPGFYTYVGRDGRRLEYGQPGVVSNLTRLAAEWNVDHPNSPIGVGDVGERGGAGNFRKHPDSGHAGGVIVDIRPMRNDGASGQDARTRIGASAFDRDLTIDLLQRIQALSGFRSVIFGNYSDRFPGARPDSSGRHNDHMHVVFRNRAGCRDYDLVRALSSVGWGIFR